MMSIINYLSACRRLKECDKFIKLQGRQNLPTQILAQRDMIELERKYYGEECQTLGFILMIACILCLAILVPYLKITGAI